MKYFKTINIDIERPINSQWAAFEKELLPPDVGQNDRALIQRSFFAGALAFARVLNFISAPNRLETPNREQEDEAIVRNATADVHGYVKFFLKQLPGDDRG